MTENDHFQQLQSNMLNEFFRARGMTGPTREFIFSPNPPHNANRNHVIPLGRGAPKTTLNTLLRGGLDETELDKIFTSPYELGCRHAIPEEKRTLSDLARAIDEIGRQDPENYRMKETDERKQFQSITETIKSITGKTFRDYPDKQNTLRVFHLLERLANQRSTSTARPKRILNFIELPANRASLEFRSSYPTTESQEHTWLINDILSYLSIELEHDEATRTNDFFYTLIDRANGLIMSANEYASGDIEKYKFLENLIDSLDIELRKQHHCVEPRLDRDLFLHVHRAEYIHFVSELSNIIEATRPSIRIKNIEDKLQELAKRLWGPSANANRKVPMNEVLPLLRANHTDIIDLISAATNLAPKSKMLERAAMYAEEILFRRAFFGSEPARTNPNYAYRLRDIIVALCLSTTAIDNPPQYRPHLFSDNSQSRSALAKLETKLDRQNPLGSKELPEGYYQYWSLAFEWMLYATAGMADFCAAKFSTRLKILGKIKLCTQLSSIEDIESAMEYLESHLPAWSAPALYWIPQQFNRDSK